MVDGNLFPYTGKITFADPSYNSTTGTFLIRATVNNPAGVLRPNQYVRVRLTGAIRPNAVVVPQRAVQQCAKGHFVWVVNKDNQAELRPVTVGEWKGDGWLISEGLADGDKVVVDGGVRLSQGAAGEVIALRTDGRRERSPPGGATTATGDCPRRRLPAFPSTSRPGRRRSTPERSVRCASRPPRTSASARRSSITGYADSTGNAAANVELAKKRARRRARRARARWASSLRASSSRRRRASPAAAATTRRAAST